VGWFPIACLLITARLELGNEGHFGAERGLDKLSAAHCAALRTPTHPGIVDDEGNPGRCVLENSDQRFTSYRSRQCVITVNTPTSCNVAHIIARARARTIMISFCGDSVAMIRHALMDVVIAFISDVMRADAVHVVSRERERERDNICEISHGWRRQLCTLENVNRVLGAWHGRLRIHRKFTLHRATRMQGRNCK